MDFPDYQRAVRETDQTQGRELTHMAVHLLGLAGEAGSVATAYKKYLRDGAADATYKLRLREELGDVLWYVATLANKLDLNLDEIAAANLDKTRSRWLTGSAEAFDTGFPETERLPRLGTYAFIPDISTKGYPQVRLYFNGRPLGDPLTDNTATDDGYRFHDIFHLAYATYLGWSPVTRALLKRKRRSDPATDEQEDGGRAIVAEEGLSLFAFAYGAQHNHLAGVTRLDQQLLDGIALMTSGLEVGSRSHADFERAILEGHRVYRLLLEHGGGEVDFDADAPSLAFRPPTHP